MFGCWLRLGLLGAFLVLLGCFATLAAQHAAGTDATVQRLITEPLAEAPGKELDLLTVEYPPGGASNPHRHDATVLVYVLEGAVEMQVAGQPLVRLGPGGTFIERPADVHAVSRNASASAPAKILVVALKSTGAPLSRPAAGT